MKTILLAVVGRHPDRKALGYARQLSQRIEAELVILRVARPAENTRQPGLTPGVRYQPAADSGNPDTEIINYVHGHREVICTIYDAPREMLHRHKGRLEEIRRQLPVPLVVVRS